MSASSCVSVPARLSRSIMKQTRTGSAAGTGGGEARRRSEQCGHPVLHQAATSAGAEQRVLKQPEVRGRLGLEREQLAHPLAAGRTHAGTQVADRGAVRRPSRRSRRAEPGGTRKPVSPSAIDLRRSADGGRDDRHARGAGFERDVRQPFGERRQHDHVGRADERVEVGAEARQHDAAGQSEFRDAAFQFRRAARLRRRARRPRPGCRDRLSAAASTSTPNPFSGLSRPAARTTCDTPLSLGRTPAAGRAHAGSGLERGEPGAVADHAQSRFGHAAPAAAPSRPARRRRRRRGP